MANPDKMETLILKWKDDLFEGVNPTTVILAPGACRRGALNSTSCVGNIAGGLCVRCVR